jgi:hypothetical protein
MKEDKMAKQKKVSGKVRDKRNGNYQIDKGNGPDEVDLDLELPGGQYTVEKLETETLPKRIPDEPGGTLIRWFNNFSIQENNKYIKKKYKVKIPNLHEKLKDSKLVIYSDTHVPKLYYYEGTIDGDTFELEDGDPGAGGAP